MQKKKKKLGYWYLPEVLNKLQKYQLHIERTNSANDDDDLSNLNINFGICLFESGIPPWQSLSRLKTTLW